MGISLRMAVVVSALLSWAPAAAQNYAAPGGLDYAGDGSCSLPATPCNLRGAVEDATDLLGSTEIRIWVPNAGGTALYREELTGAARINEDVFVDTWTTGPMPSVEGTVVVVGEVVVGASNVATLAPNLELRVSGPNGEVELRDAAEFGGEGWLTLTAGTRVQLGDPSAGAPGASPKTGFFSRLRVDAEGGSVAVVDQAEHDSSLSSLFVRDLDVRSGDLRIGDNALWIFGVPEIVQIAEGAAISGTGPFVIAPDPAVLGGPANERAGALVIGGGGRLALDIEKITDAGVLLDLPEIGGGGLSSNRSGALYLPRLRTVRGTFQGGLSGRTEFDQPVAIDGDLSVLGPLGEVFPLDGDCETGNEGGLYFAGPIDVGGDLLLDRTDDPLTAGCTEGVAFEADALSGGNRVTSAIAGGFSSAGVSGVRLDAVEVAHSLSVGGSLAFDETPRFVFAAPSPGGESCTGNELVLTGALDPQLLRQRVTAEIPSLRVQKSASGLVAAIETGQAEVLVSQALTVARGAFDENGLLAPGSVAPVPGLACAACPALPRDDCLRPIDPAGASLKLTSKGTLSFKWARGGEVGAEDLGDPRSDTDYSFCLYDLVDGQPRLALAASLPAGSSWASKGTSVKYGRKDGAPDGMTKAALKPGPEGRAKVSVKGKGVPLPALPLAQEPYVAAQLVNAAGSCWGAEFQNDPKRNDARKFVDTGG